MRIWTLVVAMACAVALGGSVSEADTVAAMQGHGWPNHFDSCFGSSWALMRNNCGGPAGSQRLLIIPTQARYWGYNSIYARASGNGVDTGTNCQGISTYTYSTGQGAVSFTQIVSTSTSASPEVLNLGPITVYPAGTMHFECKVAQGGGQVFNIDFQ